MGSRRLVLLLALLAAGPAAAAPSRDIDAVALGETVAGPRVSPSDLEGRVVVCYVWCVSCPMSTGAFPWMNQFTATYADKGVAVVGFQVRRNPEVDENDVVWYLEHLRPAFPVTHLGFVQGDWPQAWLPWAVVFDHEGRKAYAGGLEGLAAAVDAALAKAPDYLAGGPYATAAGKAAAAAIAADRAHVGTQLPALRGAASGDGPEAAEAASILAAVEREFDRQVAKAERDACGPVEQAEIFARLAEAFAGDELGERAKARHAEITGARNYAEEAAAHSALAAAKAAFRRLPPPGEYVYHPTEMIYRVSDSKPLRERRVRIIAEFRLGLRQIAATWPGTQAAVDASDLFYAHPIPPLTPEEAADRLARARALADSPQRPLDLLEAWLLLSEVAGDEEASEAARAEATAIAATITKDREDALTAAREAYAALVARADGIERRIAEAGSGLPRAEADAEVARLQAIAGEAGPDSALARRIRAYAKALDESYAGPAVLGVSFDGGHAGPGARIGTIHPGSAAARAGLAEGDVVEEIDGKPVADMNAVRALLGACRASQVVAVKVRRAGGATETLQITLGRRM